MFMQEPDDDAEPDPSLLPRLAIVVPALATLVLGVFPGLVTGFLDTAAVIRW